LINPDEVFGTHNHQTAVLERQWWANAPVNDGCYSLILGANRNPYGLRRRDPRALTMPRPRITVTINVNVAACLFGIAAIIKALM
jgi:hypothetical protein